MASPRVGRHGFEWTQSAILHIANFPEIARNRIYSQNASPVGGKQQDKQTKTNYDITSISARPGQGTIKDGERGTDLLHQRPSSAQAPAEAPPFALPPRLGARAGRQSLRGTASLFRPEAPRSQLGSGCSPALSRERARRFAVRNGRLAPARTSGGVSFRVPWGPGSRSRCGSAIWRRVSLRPRSGALPPCRTFQSRRGPGRRAGPETPPPPRPRAREGFCGYSERKQLESWCGTDLRRQEVGFSPWFQALVTQFQSPFVLLSGSSFPAAGCVRCASVQSEWTAVLHFSFRGEMAQLG